MIYKNTIIKGEGSNSTYTVSDPKSDANLWNWLVEKLDSAYNRLVDFININISNTISQVNNQKGIQNNNVNKACLKNLEKLSGIRSDKNKIKSNFPYLFVLIQIKNNMLNVHSFLDYKDFSKYKSADNISLFKNVNYNDITISTINGTQYMTLSKGLDRSVKYKKIPNKKIK